jgi:hypothetical protein
MEGLRRRGISGLDDSVNQEALQELKTRYCESIKDAWREKLSQVEAILANGSDEDRNESNIEDLAIVIGKQLGFGMDYASTDGGARELRVVLDSLYEILEEKE